MNAVIDNAEQALQTALLSALASHAEMIDLFGDPPRLFEQSSVEHGVSLPYLEITRHRIIDASGDETPALEHTIDIEVTGSIDAASDLRRALSVIRQTLDTSQIYPEGHQVLLVFPILSETLNRRDAHTINASLRVRAISQPESHS